MRELRTLLPYFRPYLKGFAWGLLFVVLANVFTLAGPYLLKLAIDGLSDPSATHRKVAGYAGLIVVTALLGGAARFGMRELLNGLSRRMETDLRNDFFRHLMRLDASFYGSVRTGDLMSRATNDTLAVRMVAGPAIMYTVNTAVSFTLALALMFYLSPTLTLYALAPLVVLPPVVLGFGRVIHRRFQEIQEQFSVLSTMVQENLTGVRIVRAYTQEREQTIRFDELNRDYRQRNMRLAMSAGLFHPLLAGISGLAMVLVLWFGGREVMDGRMTVGGFVAFNSYLVLLIWPMISLGWVVNLFQRGSASMARMNRILETRPAVASAPDPVHMDRARGGIEFRNVSFTYPGASRPVIRDLSFRVEPGETVAIVGPTGSGKSTVVALLARLYDPEEGEILMDGHPLATLALEDVRRAIGMVPQDSFLFSDTLAANIALGISGTTSDAVDQEAQIEESVERATRIAQLHEQVSDFPRGYDTMLGERGINLSGGQKQRAALARAIARDPAILMLDDALSAVDTQTEARILEDLRTVLAGRTAFIISHRVTAVMNADQILVMDDGAVVERGRHADLLTSDGTYARLLRRQLLEEALEADE
ncbi:MAG: ABC transporter ATP-binding protein/permease [Gemmatimonadota bacterium]|nr:ABC transporter ATP-binding protein/permease [Gemmatimonadota bacterium]